MHADYGDVSQLASLLQGVHTVLSFVIPSINTTGKSDEQKNLVDAAIRAGVKRFAPSEWVGWNLDPAPWYQYKKPMREYLAEVNKDAKVLEYCLFQPGFFTNYLVHPRRTTKHLQTLELNLDFPNRRAIVAEGSENSHITLTTVRDLAAVVALAVEYPGEWPVVGGIRGEHMTVGELLALGERIYGRSPLSNLGVCNLLTASQALSMWRSSPGTTSRRAFSSLRGGPNRTILRSPRT